MNHTPGHRTQTVLVIDDDEMIRRLIPVRLKSLGARVICAADGETGIRLVREHPVDLILLDVSMDGMNGFDVCGKIRQDEAARDIPVIFLTGSNEAPQKARGFELGAVDYITKPFDAAELLARVRAALRTQALVHQLENQARTDSLTGLLNRQAFAEIVTKCLKRLGAEPDYRFTILFLDLDRFKLINDSLGHAVGDELLVTIAGLLRRCARQSTGTHGRTGADAVARLGGDEFAILLDELSDLSAATDVARRIQQTLNRPIQLGGYRVNVTGSIGIRLCDNPSNTPDELLRDSDIAMYRAKAGGRAREVVFSPEMHAETMERMELEQALDRAIHLRQFQLLYQPIVHLETGRLAGLEALIRWNRGPSSVVTPGAFIHVAEETGVINPMTDWCLSEACRQLRAWSRLGVNPDDFFLSLNLSPVFIASPQLTDAAARAFDQFGVDPRALVFEVTESAIMNDMRTIIPALERLRHLGVRIAMDDFGTGYSSLALLNELPVDLIKLDMSFVKSMTRSRAHAAIVSTIITLADNLGLEIIAEGLETEYQLVQLQTLDCRYGQGFHFSRPVAAADAGRLLRLSKQYPVGPASLGHIQRAAPPPVTVP